MYKKRIIAFAMVAVMLCVSVVPALASEVSADPTVVTPADENYFFDYDAVYDSKSVWILDDGLVTVNTWHDNGLLYWGDLKFIEGSWIPNAVYNFKVGTEDRLYPSFCANYGSRLLGEDSHQYEDRTDLLTAEERTNVLSAFNYIYDTWGSLDSWKNPSTGAVTDPSEATKVLAQMAVWMLIDVDVGSIKAFSGHEILNDYLADVMQAVATGYAGSGNVIDIVFLANTTYAGPEDHIYCQPQIVPVYRNAFDEPLPGSLTIGKDLGKAANYSGSITGGYAGEAVPDAKGKYDHSKYVHDLATKIKENGNNWFQYNGAMDFTVQDSYTFDLVQGDKLTKVGEYTITWNGGKSFTITFNDQMAAVGAKLSISNNMQAFKNKNDKGFDDSYIWTTSPGQLQFGFSGTEYTFTADWVKDLKNVNVYIHLDGLKGYENTYDVPAGTTFNVLVTGPSFPNGKIFEVPVNGSIKIDGLKAGAYTVRELVSDWAATYYVNGSGGVSGHADVTVTANGNANVKIVNVPGITKVSEILFTKIVRTDAGDAGCIGFDFDVYTEIDADGNPVESSLVDTVTTKAGGIGYLVMEGYDPGTTFYIFENMSDSQSAMYRSGPQGAYLEVVSAGLGASGRAALNTFVNEVAFGDLYADVSVLEEYFIEFYSPVYKTDGSNDTLVSWVGYGKNAAELPDGFTGYFLDNGFTYLKIDVSALEALGDDGATIGIALSNQSGGNSINDRWNTPVGHTYNVKIVDGKLEVTCDLIEGAFGVLLSGSAWPAGYNPNADIKHNNVSSYNLPADDFIYLFFHIGKGAKWFVQPLTVVGWVFDHGEGPFLREYSGNDVVMKVSGADGMVYEGAPGLVKDLKAGEYTVAIFVDGIAVGEMQVIVEAGTVVSANFGTLIAPYAGVPDVIYDDGP